MGLSTLWYAALLVASVTVALLTLIVLTDDEPPLF